MIAHDQPTIFPDDVIVRVSSAGDGTMSFKSLPENTDEVWQNRDDFIRASGGDVETTALVYVTYNDARSYEEYQLAEAVGQKLSATEDDIADGLATQAQNLGLFLPVADCCATVLYDTVNHALMLSHLGRHSVEKHGAIKSLNFMKAEFGTSPENVIAWLSPAVGAKTYPVLQRDSRGLKELIVQDLCAAGVPQDSIEISSVDTAENPEYFSHSQYQKDRRVSDGRFAVYASMRK